MKTRAVYVRTYGGVGNVLFQVLHGVAYAAAHDVPADRVFIVREDRPQYDLPAAILSGFNVVTERAVTPQSCPMTETRTRASYGRGLVDTPWPEPKTNSRLLRPADEVLLDGYFQSLPAAARALPDVISRLRFSEEEIEESAKLRAAVTKPLRRVAFVHVRRGDYAELSWLYTPLTETYYAAARRKVLTHAADAGAQVTFVVVSDDPTWCGKQTWLQEALTDGSEDTEVVIAPPASVGATLHFMSTCDYAVCANSTFSLWGAVLMVASSGLDPAQVVCVPKAWFTEGTARCPEYLNTESLVPPSWGPRL